MGPLEPLVEAFGPLILVFLGIAGIAGAFAIDRFLRWPDWIAVAMVVPFILRTIDMAATAMQSEADIGAIPILGPMATGTLLLAAIFGAARWNRNPPPGTLWFPVTLFFVIILSFDLLLLGTFSQDAAIAIIALFAIWAAPSLRVEAVVGACQAAVGLILVLSLVVWMAGGPGASMPYEGMIPGMDFRVSGVMPHPNHLGPMTVMWILLDQIVPLRRSWRLPMNSLAILLLLASQSKTSWAVFAFAILALALSGESARQQLVVLTAAGSLVVGVMIFAAFELTDVVDEETATSLTSLTGRTDVWAAGLREWRETNIFMGAGGDVFKLYAERTGAGWAAQAHNQFIQTGAGYGLIGLAALLAYSATLVRVAVRLATRTRNMSVALVGVLLLRSMAETPLDKIDPDHLLPLLVLFALHRAADEGRPPLVGGWRRRGSRQFAIDGQVAARDRFDPELVPSALAAGR